MLGAPYDDVMPAAFIPLAYTIGTDFKPARRVPREQVLHWDRWEQRSGRPAARPAR